MGHLLENSAFASKREAHIYLLYELSQKLNSSLNLKAVLNNTMDTVLEVMKAERGYFLLIDKRTGELKIEVARNIDKVTIESKDFSISKKIIDQVAKEGKPILTSNALQDPRFRDSKSIFLYAIRSILCVPLLIKEKVIGVIYIDSRIRQGIFKEEDKELLMSIANQAAIAIENARLYEELENTYLQVIKTLANAIEAKSPYTKGHSERVTEYAIKIGRTLGFTTQQLKELEIAAILHDVGKIGVKEEILNKPGKLEPEEMEEIKKHPKIGYDIISPINLPEAVKLSVLHHQERYDGKGYPDGITGDDINIYARIIAVCDSYDAMTSDRIYRPHLPKEVAIEEIKKNAGTQFDPIIVKAFLKAFSK